MLCKKKMRELSKKQLREENRVLKTALEKQGQEIVLLRQKIDLLVRKVFGASSEKLDSSQLDLFLLQTEKRAGKSARLLRSGGGSTPTAAARKDHTGPRSMA